MSEILYAYGIVRDDFRLDDAPGGIDDAPLTLVRSGRVAALVSRLPAHAYDARAIESASGDVAWLSPRALAHDRVLSWAHDRGPVIPLPMFTLWGSEAALRRSLGHREGALHRVFARVAGADEFGLRIHRSEAAMLAAADALDPALAALRAESQRAAPGQRYLLERKHAAERRKVARAAGHRLAEDAFARLAALARLAVARPLGPGPGGEGVPPDATLVLNAAFLVERGRNAEFRGAVAALMRPDAEGGVRGVLYDFTGPWPPYNFVDAVAEEDPTGRARRPRRAAASSSKKKSAKQRGAKPRKRRRTPRRKPATKSPRRAPKAKPKRGKR